ncbi:hypothetical protein LTR29_015549 [Friedmanniomyces endolithicus]|nr:hypothetical protein LTR29_015549 [Friedmanniomyces endolithicus]
MSIAATSEISVACSDEMYTNEWIFPRGTTAWGFYVAGFSDVTDELKAIATQRCTGLGLTNQHTYYNPFTGASRRDEVRLCIQLLGPDRQASRGIGNSQQRNFLAWSDSTGKAIHMFYGHQVEPDLPRLAGIYEIYRAGPQGPGTWLRYDFSAGAWVRYQCPF